MRDKCLSAVFLGLVTLVLPVALAIAGEEAKTGDEKDEKGAKAPFTVQTPDDPAEKAEAELSMTLGGARVVYVAKTGFTPIFSADGKQTASIFSTSYIRKDESRERPVTFLFNGGPGAASAYLHVGAFGPKAFPAAGAGLEAPPPPYKLEDNPDTLLDVTDMVFVDPVGTGFSYALETGEKKEFWDVIADIRSMAEFIRVWLTQNDRWGARVFLGGESYGGLRAGGLAGDLDGIGVAPSGVILISPALSYLDVQDDRENFVAQVQAVPAMAAIAQYHQKLAPELQATGRETLRTMVDEWCLAKYLPGLWKGNRLPSEEFEALAADLARFTGIPLADVRAARLRLGIDDFSEWLLRDKRVFLSLYDGRLTAPGIEYSFGEDPVMGVAGETYKTALTRFFTEELGMKTLRAYNYMSDEVRADWDFTLGRKGEAGYPSAVRYLSQAMRRLPYLRVFLAAGRYDLVTPAESSRQSLSRLDIPRERLTNIESHLYEGGHMMYINPEARRKLASDLRAWITGQAPAGKAE